MSGTVTVLFGAPNITFPRVKTLPVGSGPNWVSIADVNGDSRLDLLVANNGDGTVSVILNTSQ